MEKAVASRRRGMVCGSRAAMRPPGVVPKLSKPAFPGQTANWGRERCTVTNPARDDDLRSDRTYASAFRHYGTDTRRRDLGGSRGAVALSQFSL